MSLITGEELARGLLIGAFGGLAGLATVAMPGSALWLLPASIAVSGCILTVPEVRSEVTRALPALAPAQKYLAEGAKTALWSLPGVRRPEGAAPPRLSDGCDERTPPPHPVADGTLRPRQWLHAVNERPDDNPHLTVVGPSGSGKTTFVSAALGQRSGRVVVLTPKVSPGAWRGAEVVTLDDDLSYQPLADAIEELKTEAKQRTLALRRGEPLEPLTIVLDELPELHAEIPGAGKFAVRLSRWGRELGMRQVIIATSDDALNIPGWAATRSNYARVELGKPTPDGSRPATLDDGQSRQRLDLSRLKEGAERARLRPWRGDAAATQEATQAPAEGATTRLVPAPSRRAVPANEAATLLASLFPEAISPRQDDERMGITPVPGNGSNAEGEGHSSVTVTRENGGVTVNATLIAPGPTAPKDKAARTAYEQALIALYRAAGAEGKTFANVYKLHKGTKEIVFPAWQEGRDRKEPA